MSSFIDSLITWVIVAVMIAFAWLKVIKPAFDSGNTVFNAPKPESKTKDKLKVEEARFRE